MAIQSPDSSDPIVIVPVVIHLEIETLAGELERNFPKADRRVMDGKFAVDGLNRVF
jgi:hypothetical protein